MGDYLKNREMMILEMLINACFRQQGKETDQADATQKEHGWDHHVNRAGIRIKQQNQRIERITCDLRCICRSTAYSLGLRQIRWKCIGEHCCAARPLTLKR